MNSAEEKMWVDAYYDYEKRVEASDHFNPLPNVILSYERDGYLSKSLYELLLDPITAKKVLIKNSFGLLGNLLYKCKDKVDIELLDFFIQKDIRRVDRSGRLCASNFDFVPYKIRNDKNFFLRFISVFPNCLFLASDELKKDKDFVLDVVSNGEDAYEYIHEDLKKDKNFICTLLSSNPYVFKYISDEFKNDKEIALNALNSVPSLYEYIGEELKNNKDIFRKIVPIYKELDLNVIQQVGTDILNDKEIMIEYFKKYYKTNDLRDICVYFIRGGKHGEDVLRVFLDKEKNDLICFIIYSLFEYSDKKLVNYYLKSVAKAVDHKLIVTLFSEEYGKEEERTVANEFLDYIIAFAKNKITMHVPIEVYEDIYKKYGTKYNKYIKCDEIEIYDEELPF